MWQCEDDVEVRHSTAPNECVSMISAHLKIGGHLFRCVLSPDEGEVPWQQISDPADGVVGDAFEHLMEIEFRIETVELGVSEQRVDG